VAAKSVVALVVAVLILPDLNTGNNTCRAARRTATATRTAS
jgi:phosphotransacetylase